MAGLFTYPMAAFAKRVAAQPESFSLAYRQEAITFTTAVLETYSAFRQDMHFSDSDAEGYYAHPMAYADLQCDTGSAGDQEQCQKERSYAGEALPMNQNLGLLRSMAEVASAADSDLYRAAEASFPWTEQAMIDIATQESPRLIAKFVRFFQDFGTQKQLDDGTIWIKWPYMSHDNMDPEGLSHGDFTVDGLVRLWENEGELNELLARNGYTERVGLTSTYMTYLANTFLRRVWYYNSTHGYNLLTATIDGPDEGSDTYPPAYYGPDEKDGWVDGVNGNPDCGGFAGLAQFDPWVWVRCRDAIFNAGCVGNPGSNQCQQVGQGECLNASGQCVSDMFSVTTTEATGQWRTISADGYVHAALLRYRAWWANQ